MSQFSCQDQRCRSGDVPAASASIGFRVARRLLPAATLGLLCFSPLLHAQTPVLEEVVVTAQKRAESLQDVPVAVSAIAGDDLANTGFRDVADISAQVPSLIVTSNSSPLNTSFRIRRIGNEGNIPTFEPDTALMVDGAFRSRSGLGLGDMVDVKSVEVLKGPQSTLYGKNAGAGVISISTQGPTDDFEGMAELSRGSEGYLAAKASLNLPISERLAARLSLSGSRRDALVDNLAGGDFDNIDGKALRAQLRYDISDRLTARLIVGRSLRDMNPALGDDYNSASQIAIIETAGGQVTNNDPDDRIVEHSDRTHFKQTADDAVLSFEYQGDAYTVAAITGVEDYDIDILIRGAEQMSLALAQLNDRQAGTSFSQEFRIASDNGSDFSWLLGAFYYDNEFIRGDRNRAEFVLEKDIEEYGGAVAGAVLGMPGVLLPVPVLGEEGDSGDYYVTQNTRSLGLFTQESLRLGEALELAVGLRYSLEKKDGSIEQSNRTASGDCGPLGTNLVCTLTPNGNNFDDDDQWSAFTGNVNLSYFVTEESMLYALYSTGFKAGGYSLQNGGASADIRPFDQEKIRNIELGWKTELWDRRARINGAVFHTEYEDFQNASFIGLVFAVNNAEKVTVDGIEIDSTWLLTQSLTATVNAAYIEAVYDQYSGGQCYYGRSADNALGQCDLSGETLPYAPKLTGNIALSWEQPLLTGDFYARLDYRYAGAANYSAELDPRHDEDAYTVANVRLGWRNATVDIAGWVKNLSDELYYAQKAPANLATAVDRTVGSPEGSYQNYLGDPRTYGVTLRLFF